MKTKRILLLFMVLVLTTTSFGYSQEWKALSTNSELTIYTKVIEYKDLHNGIDYQRVVFKYENHTPNALEINFQRKTQYGDKTYQSENEFVVEIPANSSVAYQENADKENPQLIDKAFFLFKKDNQGFITRELENFEITNLKMKRI